jgi:sialic acid synthase SpsE
VQLLEQVAGYGLPTYLSTGVSKLADIEAALSFFPQAGAREPGMAPVTLLHCVTAYPAPPSDYNLRLLPLLASLFGVACGVSDHSLDPLLVPVLSCAMGASAIEKHFCLSRGDSGLDDPIAVPPADFARMVRSLEEAAAAGPAAAIADMEERYGKETVAAVLGDGLKRLSPAEAANYGRTNRSLHALRAIAAGEPFTADTVGVLRTEKVLRPGLAPVWLSAVLGRRARRDIPAGEGIGVEDI